MAEAAVLRFGRSERALHTIHAAAFVALLVSGVALYLPGAAGALGSRATLKTVHLGVAAAWVVAMLVVVALGDRRRLRATVRELDGFGSDDASWLRRRPVPQGRFNAGQKVHTVLQAAAAVLFLVSGALLWLGARDQSFRLDGSVVLHDALTVGTTALVLGHLYLALVHPPTRPALGGMIGGSVPADFARRHHAKWRPTADPEAHEPAARRWSTPTTWLLLAAAGGIAATSILALV